MKTLSHMHIGLALFACLVLFIAIRAHTEAAGVSSILSPVFHGKILAVLPCANGIMITLVSGVYLVPPPPVVKIYRYGITLPGFNILGRYNPIPVPCVLVPPIPTLGTVTMYGTSLLPSVF